jgi:hypothetical protein
MVMYLWLKYKTEVKLNTSDQSSVLADLSLWSIYMDVLSPLLLLALAPLLQWKPSMSFNRTKPWLACGAAFLWPCPSHLLLHITTAVVHLKHSPIMSTLLLKAFTDSSLVSIPLYCSPQPHLFLLLPLSLQSSNIYNS